MIEQALIKTLGFGVKDFVEKAVQGGWDMRAGLEVPDRMEAFPSMLTLAQTALKEKVLLDPLAWQAVGKVEGWKKYAMIEWYDELGTKRAREAVRGIESWHYQMLRFVDALIETV